MTPRLRPVRPPRGGGERSELAVSDTGAEQRGGISNPQGSQARPGVARPARPRGAVSAANSPYYQDNGYYAPAPRYYGPTYAPAPVYGYGYAAPAYPAATIVYSSGPRYHGHRHRNHYRDGHHYRRYR